MEVYLDTEYKVHAEAGTDYMTIADAFFDNKCPNLVESYRYVPAEATWTRDDGAEFTGEMITPWRDIHQYDDEQLAYEYNLLSQYEKALSSIEQALEVS